MTVQPGELWVADIPFTNGQAFKKRPVLVLWLDGQDAVVAAVTSSDPRTSTDVSLADWRSAGLRVASTVRLARLAGIQRGQVHLIRLNGPIPFESPYWNGDGSCADNTSTSSTEIGSPTECEL